MSSIVVITSNDDFAHVYPGKEEALADHSSRRGGTGELEFFNAKGLRLKGVFDRNGRLVRLKKTARRVDVTRLHARLAAVLTKLRAFIKAHIDADKPMKDGTPSKQALDEVNAAARPFEEWTRGRALGPALALFRADGRGVPNGRGGLIHNWLHH